MKTLFLVRHAKSSWDKTAMPDKDRPLNARGRSDAPKMGERLAKRNVKSDLILSSPALRALSTAEIIAKKLGYKLKDIVVLGRLAVDRKAQGMHLGASLLQHAVNRAVAVSQNAGVRALLVHALHERARQFYERATGFNPRRRIP